MITKQKVLVFDIETAPMLAYVWDRKEQNISTKQLKTDWYVMAWSAKWLGDPPSKIMYRDQRNAKQFDDDKAILVALWKLLDEADIVITQNGKNFDSPKLNARFIFHGMKPPQPYQHLDTYQIVRKAAKFTSSSLEYLTAKLCTKYRKLEHSKYPGLSLWTACLAGDVAAWEEMKRYNIHDVLATEELYGKIKAWAPRTMAAPFAAEDRENQCEVCGESGQVLKRGFLYSRTTKRQRYQCKKCGSWWIG